MNILLRTVFDKPEMLYLSLKYEQKAREYFDDDYLTIFVIDVGHNPKCLDVIKDYPYKFMAIKRGIRHFVCANIMEGLKFSSEKAENYIINMEDDIILHKTFFEFVKKANDLVKDGGYSVIAPWGYSAMGDPDILKKTDYSCGPGIIINKDFFINYMSAYATPSYYQNWIPTIDKVNSMNADNPNATYSIKKGNQHAHLDWDGLMRRLIDYNSFNHGISSYVSLCYRLLHIGFYGFNRRGHYPSGIDTFDKRIDFLESHIFDPETLTKLDGTYTDYFNFDPRLDGWDGSLKLEV